MPPHKFDWVRVDQTRSLAQADGPLELAVECDTENGIQTCEWTVRGWAKDRRAAILRAEEAALAAMPEPEITDATLDALLALAQSGDAHIVVRGNRDSFTLFSLLRRARKSLTIVTDSGKVPHAPKVGRGEKK